MILLSVLGRDRESSFLGLCMTGVRQNEILLEHRSCIVGCERHSLADSVPCMLRPSMAHVSLPHSGLRVCQPAVLSQVSGAHQLISDYLVCALWGSI